MTTPGGCNAWATIDDLPVGVADMHAPAEWCVFLGMATDILWALTQRRWTGQSVVSHAELRAAPPTPGEGGAWPYHDSWGRCPCYQGMVDGDPLWAGQASGHHEPVAIRLPHDDVTQILSVTVDGVPFIGWRLDGQWLTRVDGRGWSACHGRSLVTYLHGRLPPAAGVAACVTLAVEFGRAAAPTPDKPCSLPQRLQSVTRQGISFAALDDMAFLEKGLTGIYSIDLFIRSVNPNGRAQAASVWSPDLPRGRRFVQ